MPIRFLIQKRRLLYWHHVINAGKNSLLNKFYQAQKNMPVKGDWINLIENDKKDFNISYNDNDLTKISKAVFKKRVKKEAVKVALKYLNNLKSKHSKMDNIKISDEKMKPSQYLLDKRINPDQAKFIFKVRTRMLQMKCNFKNQFKNNYTCDLCKINMDNQEHLLECKVLQHFVPEIQNTHVKYKDIFGNVEKIIPAAKLLYKVYNEREALLKIEEDMKALK